MRISAKSEYACLAVLELARNSKIDLPLRMKKIAVKHKIPESFLVQILFKLRRVGIVAAVRGSIGGYYLIPKPDEITLGLICSLMDDWDSCSTNILQEKQNNDQKKMSPQTSNSLSQTQSLLKILFEKAEQKRLEFLNSITFQELLNYSAGEMASF
ncbi:MAG: Rrf2 family transcriptional regulator [Planctomycetia bacterium]|nr:Rrf2 family transcriptional regulator [Planctomycetia bacterium]